MIHHNPVGIIRAIQSEFPNETVGFGYIHDYLSPYQAMSSIVRSVRRNWPGGREEADILLSVLASEVK